jgi:hypothetical protein
MSDIEKLKQSLFTIVEKSECNFSDIVNILEPFADYISNSQFGENMHKILEIILMYNSEAHPFSFSDIQLLSSDIAALTSLLNCTLAVIASLPEVTLTSTCKFTQDMLFKILTYVFLVLLPSKLNLSWSIQQKTTIINMVLSVYNMFVSSGLAKSILDKIHKLFVQKGWCKCICKGEDKVKVLEKNFPVLALDLNKSLKTYRGLSIISRQLNFN